MGPSTKEAVETSISEQQSAGQQAKTAASALRSDAVSLEVGVKVHGSRARSVGGAAGQTEPFSEETTTMIVFPQGAVVRVATAVHVGQMLVLTNLKTRQDAICRVVKVRSFPNLQGYVEVEFTQPQPRFWGVHFGEKPAVGGQRQAPAEVVKPKLTDEIVRPAAPAREASVTKPVEAALPQRPLAAKTSVVAVPPQAAVVVPPQAKPMPAPWVAESQPKNQAALSVSSQTVLPHTLKGDQGYTAEPRRSEIATPPILPLPETKRTAREAKPEVEPLAASVEIDSAPNKGMVAQGAANAGRGVGAFGISAEGPAEEAAAIEHSVASIREPFAEVESGREISGWRQDWRLIAACAAALIVAVLGGVWYFHSKSPASAAVSGQSSVAVEQQASSGIAQTSTGAPVSPAPMSTATGGPTETNFDALSNAQPTSNTARNVVVNEEPARSDRAAAPNNAGVAGTPKSVLNPRLMKAHPLVSLRKNDTGSQAPVLDAASISANGTGVLPEIISSSSVPAPAATGPVSVGGRIKQPRLISSTRPVYPVVAKQAHIDGDVVVDTVLDKNGDVSHLKVVSGPAMLRESALEALRHWKFEPTQLDGQPVEVEMLVTIRFRL